MPPVVQPLKNFPTFYGTRRFITVFTSALNYSLSWVRSVQSIPNQSIFLRSILILPTHLRLSLPSGFFPSGSYTNNLYAFLFSPFRPTCPANTILLDLTILIIIIRILIWLIWKHKNIFYRICRLVVRVPGYRSRCPSTIPVAAKFSEK
jgi:hypothetical protein